MFIQKIYTFILDFKLLLKSPLLFYNKWKSFLQTFLGIHKDIFITIGGHTFTLPNYFASVSVLEEIYVDNCFSMLTGCDCIIDIGGYMGDSAVYLSQSNKKIVVFEINPYSYPYLIKNIQGISNIFAYNTGVTASHEKEILFSFDDRYSMVGYHTSTLQHHKKTNIPIKNTYIGDIIQSYHPDGIKIDIEGGEYEIINELFAANLFSFKKGFIEFHILPGEEKYCDTIIHTTISFLYKNNYTIVFFDIIKKHIFTPNLLVNSHYPRSSCFFISFEKLNVG